MAFTISFSCFFVLLNLLYLVSSTVKVTNLSKKLNVPRIKVNSTNNWQIVGGVAVDILEYPYVVSITSRLTFQPYSRTCSGTYIYEPRYVLSAASCFHDNKKAETLIHHRSVRVRYGSNYAYRGGLTTGVERIYIPPDYGTKPYSVPLNIALLKTETHLERSPRVAPRPLARPEEVQLYLQGMQANEQTCVATGFSQNTFPKLMAIHVKLMDPNECADEYYKKDESLNVGELYYICTKSEGMTNCPPDEGSALICENMHGVIGVFSFAMDCNSINGPRSPAVYSRIDLSYSFIRDTIAEIRSIKSRASFLSCRLVLIFGVLLFLEILQFKFHGPV